MSSSMAQREASPVAIRSAVFGFLKDYGVLVFLGALVLYFAFNANNFVTAANFRNILEQAALPSLVALGMTAVIICGGFDLSVGAVFGFAGVVTTSVANHSGLWAGVAVGLLAGGTLGLINGTVIVRLRIDSFLATLATAFIIVGLGLLWTSGSGVLRVVNYEPFSALGLGQWFGMKHQVFIALGAYITVWGLLRRTAWGRSIYGIGGNPAAARVAGVRVGLVRTSTFVISGITAALAGILAASQISIGRADSGAGLELAAIAAVAIGGTSIAGGRGGVWRTLAGTMLVVVVADGFNLMAVDPSYSSLVQGVIVIVAVAIDGWARTRA